MGSTCFGPVCGEMDIPSFGNIVFEVEYSLSCSDPFVSESLVLFRHRLVCSNLILTHLMPVRSLL